MEQQSFGLGSSVFRWIRTHFACLTLVGIAAVGCGGDVTPPLAPPVEPLAQIGQVTLVGPDSVLDDAVAEYTLDIRDRSGKPIPAPSTGIEWKFDNPNNSAQLHELAPGRVELRVWNAGVSVQIEGRVGGWSATRQVRLAYRTPTIARITYCCEDPGTVPTYTVRVGEATKAYFTAWDSTNTRLDPFTWAGAFASLAWETADTSVATVQGKDAFAVTLRGVKIGQTTVRVRFGGVMVPATVRVIAPLPTLGALPATVEGGAEWKEIAAGSEHTCALATGGDVWCWGSNAVGSLGAGARDTAMAPRRVTTLGTPAVALSSYGSATCAAGTDGAVYCWGAGSMVTKARQTMPSELTARVASVTVGGGHACALAADGQVACWGFGDGGQLGPGGTTITCYGGLGSFYACRSDAQRMETDLRFTTLAAGATFTCGLVADGSAYCWGNIALGGPTPTGESCYSPGGPYAGSFAYACRRTPLLVTGEHRFRAIAAYGGRACAVAVAGDVWCWSEQKAPAAVSGLQNVRSVSLGEQHACAVLADDAVRCWGVNSSLALGVPDVAGVPDPWAPVSPDAPVGPSVRVSAGASHTCALGRDGKLLCWGNQRAGQLGRGSFTP